MEDLILDYSDEGTIKHSSLPMKHFEPLRTFNFDVVYNQNEEFRLSVLGIHIKFDEFKLELRMRHFEDVNGVERGLEELSKNTWPKTIGLRLLDSYGDTKLIYAFKDVALLEWETEENNHTYACGISKFLISYKSVEITAKQ